MRGSHAGTCYLNMVISILFSQNMATLLKKIQTSSLQDSHGLFIFCQVAKKKSWGCCIW
jgi:hypothetical protein